MCTRKKRILFKLVESGAFAGGLPPFVCVHVGFRPNFCTNSLSCSIFDLRYSPNLCIRLKRYKEGKIRTLSTEASECTSERRMGGEQREKNQQQ